jgi:hypothetical protein
MPTSNRKEISHIKLKVKLKVKATTTHGVVLVMDGILSRCLKARKSPNINRTKRDLGVHGVDLKTIGEANRLARNHQSTRMIGGCSKTMVGEELGLRVAGVWEVMMAGGNNNNNNNNNRNLTRNPRRTNLKKARGEVVRGVRRTTTTTTMRGMLPTTPTKVGVAGWKKVRARRVGMVWGTMAGVMRTRRTTPESDLLLAAGEVRQIARCPRPWLWQLMDPTVYQGRPCVTYLRRLSF